MSKELQGDSIENHWEYFRDTVLVDNPDEVIQYYRMVFYAGACAMHGILYGADPDDPDCIKKLQAVSKELEKFYLETSIKALFEDVLAKEKA